MPNEFVGQNGAVIKQTTTIAVTGCPKAVQGKKQDQEEAKRQGQEEGR